MSRTQYKFNWTTSIEFYYMFIHINAILYCQLFAHLMTDLRRYDWYSQVVPPGTPYKLLKFQVNGNQNKAFCATNSMSNHPTNIVKCNQNNTYGSIIIEFVLRVSFAIESCDAKKNLHLYPDTTTSTSQISLLIFSSRNYLYITTLGNQHLWLLVLCIHILRHGLMLSKS